MFMNKNMRLVSTSKRHWVKWFTPGSFIFHVYVYKFIYIYIYIFIYYVYMFLMFNYEQNQDFSIYFSNIVALGMPNILDSDQGTHFTC